MIGRPIRERTAPLWMYSTEAENAETMVNVASTTKPRRPLCIHSRIIESASRLRPRGLLDDIDVTEKRRRRSQKRNRSGRTRISCSPRLDALKLRIIAANEVEKLTIIKAKRSST